MPLDEECSLDQHLVPVQSAHNRRDCAMHSECHCQLEPLGEGGWNSSTRKGTSTTSIGSSGQQSLAHISVSSPTGTCWQSQAPPMRTVPPRPLSRHAVDCAPATLTTGLTLPPHRQSPRPGLQAALQQAAVDSPPTAILTHTSRSAFMRPFRHSGEPPFVPVRLPQV
jgi:hypothetical protein